MKTKMNQAVAAPARARIEPRVINIIAIEQVYRNFGYSPDAARVAAWLDFKMIDGGIAPPGEGTR